MANTNDFNFNGSTVTFATASLGALRSIDFSETGAQVDTTGSSDAQKSFRAGIPDPTITVTVVGPLAAGVAIGTVGDIAITWQDTGTDGTISDCVAVDRGKTGSMDGEMTSTYTFKAGQVDA